MLESVISRGDFRSYRETIELRKCAHLSNHIRINKTTTSQLLKMTGGTRSYFFIDFCAGVVLGRKDRLAQGSQKSHQIVLQSVKGVQGDFQPVGSLWGTQKCNVPNLARFGTLQRSDVSFWFKLTFRELYNLPEYIYT